MKRFTAFLLAILMIFSLAACGGKKTTDIPSVVPDENRPSNETTQTLVVYFSMPDNVDNSSVVINGETLGNTQYMAYVIQENIGANIFRIVPQTPYPTDHEALVDQAKEEQNQNARPAFEGEIENFESYDTVFVGYPIWWSDMPMIMYTFFDTYDFSGKTIVPFSTHGGSSFAGTPATIAELEPSATVANGMTISRDVIQDAEQDIIDWLKEAGYAK